MPRPKDDLSKSLVALDQHRTLIAAIELSLASWLAGGIVPGIDRDPLKKLAPDAEALLRLLHRWRDEAVKAGHTITRIVVAFEAGRDGFWLARWLRARCGSLRHSSDKHSGVAGAAAGKDRPVGYRAAQARLAWLAAWRGKALQHGRDPDAGRGGCETA